jgi:hypothetical protein
MPPQPTVTLPKGTLLYTRMRSSQPPRNDRPTWFALHDHYGPSTYGPYVHRYRTQRTLRLYDVAKTHVRQALARLAGEKLTAQAPEWTCLQRQKSDPYWQSRPPFSYILENAWGSGCNMDAAQTVCQLAALSKGRVAGWIAVDWDDPDLEGPEEVMLCHLDDAGLLYEGCVKDTAPPSKKKKRSQAKKPHQSAVRHHVIELD